MDKKIKILIVDQDSLMTRNLAKFLQENGFECKNGLSIREARPILFNWHPQFVLSDLLLPDGSGLELLQLIRSEKSLQHDFTTFIVMSSHNQKANVKNAIDAGVSDYIVKPFQFENVLKKLVYHCQNFRQLPDLKRKDFSNVDEGSLILHLTDLILRQALKTDPLDETLHNLVVMLNMKTMGVRCSIVHCVNEETGQVIASQDDKGISGLQLDLNRYPEILHVRNTNRMIAIENIEKDARLKFIKQQAKSIQFNSLVVSPIYQNGEFFGVLSLRLPQDKQNFTDNELRFVEIVSHVISLILGNQKSFQQFSLAA